VFYFYASNTPQEYPEKRSCSPLSQGPGYDPKQQIQPIHRGFAVLFHFYFSLYFFKSNILCK
jgi:hypothetical protein